MQVFILSSSIRACHTSILVAFSYLDELSKEFERSFGGASFYFYPLYALRSLDRTDESRKPGLRPYAFVKFDSFIQRTKRLYQDSRYAFTYFSPI